MCRLLAVKGAGPFEIAPYLERFAAAARASREYQGDGWGCAFLHDGAWQLYRSTNPIWDDAARSLGDTTLLLAHARSAFDTQGPRIEHTMPFVAGRLAFAFNGELRGVRLRAAGRIGAEKLFTLVRGLANGDPGRALARAAALVRSRSEYVRAANVVLSDGARLWVRSEFVEQPDYFTLHVAERRGRVAVCSERLVGEGEWRAVANGAQEVFA